MSKKTQFVKRLKLTRKSSRRSSFETMCSEIISALKQAVLKPSLIHQRNQESIQPFTSHTIFYCFQNVCVEPQSFRHGKIIDFFPLTLRQGEKRSLSLVKLETSDKIPSHSRQLSQDEKLTHFLQPLTPSLECLGEEGESFILFHLT